MQHNPQAFRLIANLLAAWEKEGFAVGVETQLQLRELTQKLPDDTHIQNLKTLLAPLFANTRDEQELFYELFDKNLKENEQFFTETAHLTLSKTPATDPSVSSSFVRTWQKIRKNWRITILVGIAILAAIWLLKNVLIPKPPPPKEDVYINVMVNLQEKEEQRMCIDSTNFIEENFKYTQNITITDTNFFYSVKSLDKITPDSQIKHIQLKTYLKDGKACIYYKGISNGQDSVRYRVCLNNKNSCSFVNYVFNVYTPSPSNQTPIPTETLAFKDYKHTPNISSLIPTEKMRFGSRFAYWNWTKTFIFLGILIAILALGKWLNRRKQLIFKDLKGNDKAPYAWTVKIDGADKIDLNDVFYTASNQLRRRSDNEISRFDVPRTVTATIKQAGRVNFQYRQLTQSNEYLLLIDMPSAANHQAQLFNFLNKALTDNEVLVERFFYDGDIRLCWNETHKRGISLKDLQHHYSEHRLIIVGSGHSFLSPLNGKLAKWATIFDRWRIKALFSTRPASEWDMREAQLAQKFRILPASLKGIGELVETIEAVEAKDYRLWKTVKDPSVQPLRLPNSLTDDELMMVLKAEFMRYNNRQADDRLVQWIAACAVYPTLHWDLTLALGTALTAPPTPQRGELARDASQTPPFGGQGVLSLLTLDNLFTINRLSWFVDGKMPEPVRKTLLKWLAETHPSVLEQTRRHLAEILKNCQPPSDSIAYEDYRLQMVMNELLLKPDARQRKALETELEKLLALDAEQDFLVAEYLNRPRTPLDFVVPDNLRKYVRVQETNRLPRSPQWVWQSFIAVPALICLWFFNPRSKECDGATGFLNNTFYCLKTPQDSLTFNEQNFCDWVGKAIDERLLDSYDNHIKSVQDSIQLNPARKEELTRNITNIQDAKERLKREFAQKGYPQNASLEEILLTESFNLIRQNALDSASFYRNIPIAYWNAGVFIYNKISKLPQRYTASMLATSQQKLRDSACIYFTKLDKWAWRDSVLTPEEVALIGKTCYPEIVQQQPQNIAPPPQQLQDRDFEPYQTRKQYGFRHAKTQETLIPPQYQNAYYFAESLAAVKVSNKWGFIDHDNNMVIPPQYDNVSQNFKKGRAQVQVGKEMFFINKTGKRIAGGSNTNIATVPPQISVPNPVERSNAPVINIIFSNAVNSAQIDMREANTQRIILSQTFTGKSLSIDKIEVGKTYLITAHVVGYMSDSAFVTISKDKLVNDVRFYNSPTLAPTEQRPPISTNLDKNPPPQKAPVMPIEGQMIFLDGGNFTMGCDEKRDAPCQDNEKPSRKAFVSAFYMGKYEVTNEEYVIFLNDYGIDFKIGEPNKGQKLIDENKWGIAFRSKGDVATAYYEVQKGYEKYPVVGVTWYGAVAYCEWLSKKTGKNYRLPTETEWEFAARDGYKSRRNRNYIYSGSNKIEDVAWYAANSSSKTHTVGTKAANELGIHDMSGNVWEWCSDVGGDDYYKNTRGINPQIIDRNNRVLRGGSAYSLYNMCRNAMRNFMAASSSNDYFGFRVIIGY